MKITVLDGYTENPGDLSWDALGSLGQLAVYDRTPTSEIASRIGDSEIVFTNKTPLSEKIINEASNLKFIGVLATGYNIVDIAAAQKKGIPVCNVPAYGTDSVSQFAIGLLLELCMRIGYHDAAVHNGRWSACQDFCFWDFPLVELAGKTMGIIGFGRIGHRTGEIARALGMNVIVSSPHEKNDGFSYVNQSEIFAKSDVIVLHCPLVPETRNLICKASIAQMKPGVMIINNSRGPLINEMDLSEALKSGKVAGAAVDVVSSEPIAADNPLLSAPNCIITPHMSWAPKEARQRIMDTSVSNLRSFLDGHAENVVNK